MPVSVDQVTSEVVAEPAPAAAAPTATPPGESPWIALAQHRDVAARARAEALRTRAEGNDD